MFSPFEITHLPAAFTLLAILALAIGSLLNVIIYRLPLMLQAERENECRQGTPFKPQSKLNLFLPRSFCPACKTPIPARFNVPLLSYCLLRGRCRTCKQPIPLRYPMVELLSCLFSLLAAWYFGFGITLLFVLLFIWILIVLFFIDLEHQLLPDSLTLSLLWLGLIANTQSLFTTLPDAVLSAALAYLALWLFIQLFYLFTHKIGMGNGDFKLFAAFGAWFGWVQLPLILLFASLTGAIVGFAYLKYRGKTKDTPIPFGPFLCLAGMFSLFLGKAIMHWYLSTWF
ncbi:MULTISPECIES: prepilin peptidase [Legionella]|uniref:Prepilin leader peptidase/N-methyltransferase n=1 Tax=Legionella maceachernii TaxID=466 RepID=A0A0W0W1M4_9GAMM|nr:A24 family peptidase [Legionella maceachernii]KTD26153.1 type 4 (IV) prepilin-like protein leader peptide processing enzyme PilD [Legionella maceachernii]SJZ71415.1 leader peptidase (prepilin peptidase) / N-methyltransferase [Legionella maceachernii]SUP02364.1 Pectic enzymes secretion protein outO [Legionella maceachernii]